MNSQSEGPRDHLGTHGLTTKPSVTDATIHSPTGLERIAIFLTTEERNERLGLLEFARWCSELGNPPNAVTEQTLANYIMFLRARKPRTGDIPIRRFLGRRA